jgi:hypothetical protein
MSDWTWNKHKRPSLSVQVKMVGESNMVVEREHGLLLITSSFHRKYVLQRKHNFFPSLPSLFVFLYVVTMHASILILIPISIPIMYTDSCTSKNRTQHRIPSKAAEGNTLNRTNQMPTFSPKRQTLDRRESSQPRK